MGKWSAGLGVPPAATTSSTDFVEWTALHTSARQQSRLLRFAAALSKHRPCPRCCNAIPRTRVNITMTASGIAPFIGYHPQERLRSQHHQTAPFLRQMTTAAR